MPDHRVGILVVGGGIAGLTTALALSRQELEVVLIEGREEFGEIGFGIQLAPNALRILDRLGLLDAIYKTAVFPSRAVLMSAVSGRRLTALEFGDEFRERYGYPYIVTHRGDLLSALVEACRESPRITLHTGKQAVGVEPVGSETVVRCADGTMYCADAVIGADGIRSVVRDYTVGDGEPIFCGDVAYRGAAPIEQVSNAAGIDNVVWWIGPKMHLIQYPIRGGQLFNQVAVFSSDAFEPGRDDDEWGTPYELDQRFRSKATPVETGVDLLDRTRRWSLCDRDPVANWTQGKVTLVGDAAHAMLQYLAQGACQALEDAICLAASVSASPDDLETAFARYQEVRLSRTERVQQWARWVGQIVHADDPYAIMRDSLLAESDNFALVDWLYAKSEPLHVE